MIERDLSLEVRVLEVTVEGAKCDRHGKCLIPYEARRKGRDIKAIDVAELTLDFTTDEEERTLIAVFIKISRVFNEKVLDSWASALCGTS